MRQYFDCDQNKVVALATHDYVSVYTVTQHKVKHPETCCSKQIV